MEIQTDICTFMFKAVYSQQSKGGSNLDVPQQISGEKNDDIYIQWNIIQP